MIKCINFLADPINSQITQYRSAMVLSSLPFIIRTAFQVFAEIDRSVQVVVKNYSSLTLSNCRWYAHHGTATTIIEDSVRPESSVKIAFRKTNVIFFGVSGYFEYVLERGSTKRRMIVTFSAPMRGKTNTVSVMLLDERDRAAMGEGASTYSNMKKDVTKLEKKFKSPIFFESSSQAKGVSKNPCIADKTIKICVRCAISSSSCATLNIVVDNL